MPNTNPTHMFISYVVEGVWFDQIKLLAPWPQTIDDAIKHRTFRTLRTFVAKAETHGRGNAGATNCRAAEDS